MNYLTVGTEEGVNLKNAVNNIKVKFSENRTGRQVVAPEFKFKDEGTGTKLLIKLNMVFPSFRVPADYSLLIGLIVFFVMGFKFPILVTSCIIWIILMIPDFLQKPLILFYFFKMGLKRNGFDGKVKFLGGEKWEY